MTPAKGMPGRGERFRHGVPMPVVDSIDELTALPEADDIRRISNRTNGVGLGLGIR